MNSKEKNSTHEDLGRVTGLIVGAKGGIEAGRWLRYGVALNWTAIPAAVVFTALPGFVGAMIGCYSGEKLGNIIDK